MEMEDHIQETHVSYILHSRGVFRGTFRLQPRDVSNTSSNVVVFVTQTAFEKYDGVVAALRGTRKPATLAPASPLSAALG